MGKQPGQAWEGGRVSPQENSSGQDGWALSPAQTRCCVQNRGSWEGECLEIGLENQNDLVQGPLHSFKKYREHLLRSGEVLWGHARRELTL